MRLIRIFVLSVCLELLTYVSFHLLPIEMAWPVDAVLSGALSLWAARVPRSCAELAGESPVTVMTKQPCSW